jgi:alpha-beta hydrolase superfamily lysophospholipase
MGGLLAVAYAENHQDRLAGVVVTGAAVVLGDMITELLALDEIPAVPLGEFVSRDPTVAQDYDEDPLNYHGAMPRDVLQQAPERIEAVRSRFGTITVPILAMHGEQDALAPMQASLDIVTGVSSGDRMLRIWPGLYHEIFNEPERDQVIGEVVRWITERLPAAAAAAAA